MDFYECGKHNVITGGIAMIQQFETSDPEAKDARFSRGCAFVFH